MKGIWVLGWFIVSGCSLAQAEALTDSHAVALTESHITESHIVAVTVYPGIASVTREAQVMWQNGQQHLTLAGLPAGLDAASLQISSTTPGVHIGSVTVEPAASAGTTDPALAALQQRQLTNRQQLDAVVAQLEALALQTTYLQALAAAPGKTAPQPAQSWQAGSDALGEAMTRIGTQKATLSAQKQTLTTEQAAISEELQRWQQTARARQQLRIALQAPAGAVQLSVRYRMDGAGWEPVYEAALDSQQRKVLLTRAALVQQRTGESWPKVAMTLATLPPHQQTQPPVLDPWWIDLHDESRIQAKGAARLMQADMVAAAPAPEAANVALPQLVATDFAASYLLPATVSLNSDERPQRVVLGSNTLPAPLRLESAPRLDAAAYLYAEVKNPLPAPLLAGRWQLSRDGLYLGQHDAATLAPGASMPLGFGVDDAVTVKAVQVQDEQAEEGVLNKEQTLSRRWMFSFHNGHPFALPLVVRDNWPVSRNQQLRIEPLPGSPAAEPVADAPGVQRWQLELAPGKTLELSPGYRVRYPFQRRVDGL